MYTFLFVLMFLILQLAENACSRYSLRGVILPCCYLYSGKLLKGEK